MKEIIISIALFFLGSILLLSPNFSNGNNTDSTSKYAEGGINFQKIPLAEAKALAVKSGKLIFIDAYTSWCGPCKLLERNTFSDPKVAAFFNKNFINLRVEMEQDKDAPEIYRTYLVRAYPTMLFIDAKGKLVKRVLGYRDAKSLMEEVAVLGK